MTKLQYVAWQRMLIDDKIERFVQTIPSLTKAKLKAAFQLFDKDKDKNDLQDAAQRSGKLGYSMHRTNGPELFQGKEPKTTVHRHFDMKTFEEVSAEYFQLPMEPQEPRVLSGNSSLVSTPRSIVREVRI